MGCPVPKPPSSAVAGYYILRIMSARPGGQQPFLVPPGRSGVLPGYRRCSAPGMIDPKKFLRPELHAAADYGMVAMHLLAPSVLGLKGSARALCYFFALVQGTLNAFTDQPLAVKRVVPFKIHGELEKFSAPVYLGLPRLSGAMSQKNAVFFNAFFFLLVAVYNLTAWDADANEPDPLGHAQEAIGHLTGKAA